MWKVAFGRKRKDMATRIIGAHPLAKDAGGKLVSRIGTIFPHANTLVTLPGIHALQRMAYLDLRDQERQRAGQGPLTAHERSAEWADAVDLVMDDDTILIRPDPDNMALAFQADDLLVQLCSTRQVRFMYANHEKVHDAVKRRGEHWRITPLPKSAEDMALMIEHSRIGIGGRPLYYYNNTTGTRFLTCHEFARLAQLPEGELRQLLEEIQRHAANTNRLGNPEVDFFLADKSFGKQDFLGHDFAQLESGRLQQVYASLREKFYLAVPMGLRQDDVHYVEWRNRMFAKLIAGRDEMVSEETFMGLSSEFYMQIEWLPGGRFHEGELLIDPIFESRNGKPGDPISDDKVLQFIFHFLREFGDLEYVNVGRVIEPLSRGRRVQRGRRDVFLAEIKPLHAKKPVVRVIRMQKYGVAERLNRGASLEEAMLGSDEYTDYILDRRLGCRQLGMNILSCLTTGKIEETYAGENAKYRGRIIWSPYFERDYIRGIASDKVQHYRLKNDEFALRLAQLLGAAAAPNLIVGRRDLDGPVVFDDGDEVLIEDERGLPTEILVVDQMGTFTDFRNALETFAVAYAEPVRKRLSLVNCSGEFGKAYLSAFRDRFTKIQQEYRRRRGAFDNLFAHRRWDEQGSFAFRWFKVLERLDHTDPAALTEAIRQHIETG
jgi:hypothetical protein